MTGEILNALGEFYIDDGKYAEAEQTCRRAVKVLENSLGEENDNTAMALNNLARLYLHQGRYTEAQTLCQKALSTLQAIFDDSHPSVAAVHRTMLELRQKVRTVARVVSTEHSAERLSPATQAAY